MATVNYYEFVFERMNKLEGVSKASVDFAYKSLCEWARKLTKCKGFMLPRPCVFVNDMDEIEFEFNGCIKDVFISIDASNEVHCSGLKDDCDDDVLFDGPIKAFAWCYGLKLPQDGE